MRYIAFAGHIGSSARNIIIPLLEFFEKEDIGVIFLHANSLVGNVSIPEAKGLESFDIFLNDYKSLKNLLETKKPMAICCLSFRSLFDIFINRLGHDYNIPTIYFEHGLYISGLGDKFFMADIRTSIKRYRNYFAKYLTFLFAERLNIFKELSNTYKCIKHNDYTNNPYDAYLFYALHGKDQLHDKFKFSDDRIFYSGYPLIKYHRDLNIERTNILTNQYALYIHQPLIQDGLTTLNYEDEKEMIRNISSELGKNGLKLIFKIHPREDIAEYQKRFAELDVVISSEPFPELLPKCKLVLGQFSTALFFATKYYVPLIIIPYAGVDDSFYAIFETIGKRINEIQGLNGILHDFESLTHDMEACYDEFNKFTIGENNSFEDQAGALITITEKLHQYEETNISA